ncbi:MAG: hypothetical protein R3D27_07980 [Hyphomicrobiaceae bacterium]
MPTALQMPQVQIANQRFIQELVIEHGPITELGRFFLKAIGALNDLGVTLEIATPEQLVTANRDNADNWLPLVQTFDPRWSDVSSENQISLIGRMNGRVIAAHAMRYFDWRTTTYHDEIESFRLLYRDPENDRLPGESVAITSTAARTISGRVAFSGAAWCHPDMRGNGLSRIMPRIGKALALARWDVDRIVAIMNEGVHSKGFAPRFGYHGVDWGVRYENCRCGIVYVAVLWMNRPQLEEYISAYLGGEKVDPAVLDRGNENERARRVS